MQSIIDNNINLLIKRYPILESCKESIIEAYNILKASYINGGKLLICGNGGSCSDAAHIVGELMKGFKSLRKCDEEFTNELKKIDPTIGSELSEKLQGALPAINLAEHASLNTAFINDVENGGLLTFAQQVYGYGKKEDVLFAISTSGNSKNTLNAIVVAKAKGMKVIGLTGENGGRFNDYCDVVIKAPQKETYMVQELHLPIYHTLCLMLEQTFFK